MLTPPHQLSIDHQVAAVVRTSHMLSLSTPLSLPTYSNVFVPSLTPHQGPHHSDLSTPPISLSGLGLLHFRTASSPGRLLLFVEYTTIPADKDTLSFGYAC